MKPVKLGIIGCGIAARDLHWPVLKTMKNKFEIVMVCNHTEPKAKDFAQTVGNVPYTLDYLELLNNPEIEAVDIILPIHLNYQVTKDALKAGKHVMLEKPLAANMDEANAMLKFEKQYPRVMMVAENYRYCYTFLQTKKYLDEEYIGKPYSAFWNIFYRLEESNKYVKTKWRIHHQYPGGFITDGGVHNIAALRLLFGEIIHINAFTKSINPNLGELDSFSLQFNTSQNVAGVFNLFFSVSAYSQNKFLIFGTKGTIEIENWTIKIYQADRTPVEEKIDDDGGYHNQFINFYNAINGDEKVISTFPEAYRDLSVIMKALKIAESKA